jgi:hypothetical protein
MLVYIPYMEQMGIDRSNIIKPMFPEWYPIFQERIGVLVYMWSF